MVVSVEGVYRNGKIELEQMPDQVRDETRVIVTFLTAESDAGAIDLRSRGIDEQQVANLRARFQAFIEDWETPEMSIYDNYDEAKARL